MYKYAIPILSIALISSIAYAMNIETNPEVIIENSNREKIIECLENVYSMTGSKNMKKEIRKCESIPMLSITGTASGAIVPPPPTTLRNHSGATVSDFINSQQLEYITHLQNLVCNHQKNSPLCTEDWLIEKLYILTEERLPGKNFFPILLGITNAESSLGLNFAKDRVGGTCAGRNNWGGIKWKKTDTGESVKDQGIPDKFGCYLYKFDSIEDYWISKVNTIRFGYKGCIDSLTPVKCLSYAYVGDRYVSEQSWVKNVSIFLD